MTMKISDWFQPVGKKSHGRSTDRQRRTDGKEGREKAFLDHFRAHYAWAGLPFDRYLPAYRYAESVSEDGGLHGRKWEEIESDIRENWELSYPGTWARFRDAIYFGWERMRT